jgi:hypothetical protein
MCDNIFTDKKHIYTLGVKIGCRRHFGPKTDEVTCEGGRQHTEEPYDLTKYHSGDKIKKH